MPIDPFIRSQLIRFGTLKGKATRRVPHMFLPRSIASMYNRYLQKIISAQIAVLRQSLFPFLPSLVEEADYLRPILDDKRTDQASWFTNAVRLLSVVNMGMDNTIDKIEYTIDDIGNRTNVWHDRQWRKMMKGAIGVELYNTEPWIEDSLKSFTSENVALITKLTKDTEQDIHSVVMGGIRAGKRAKTLQQEILAGTKLQRGIFKKVRTRAKLIAVDQVLSFNSNLNKMRQEDVGIKRYIWRDSQDRRVRPEHQIYNGQTYKWSQPPPDGHPGEPIRCRCYAEPIFDDLLLKGI